MAALHGVMDHLLSTDRGPEGRSLAGMHGILICRSFNRVCRRAANIAEHTYVIREGVSIKHVPGKNPEAA